ncbi:hypothetical protein PUN28_002259 [Cardiocondyla obscurior]|uniref:Secreted peptide n=1 Tax=Cardiocondyla obscurior TaxID=286306 RepID=A0AAW2GT58_9HYME
MMLHVLYVIFFFSLNSISAVSRWLIVKKDHQRDNVITVLISYMIMNDTILYFCNILRIKNFYILQKYFICGCSFCILLF